MKLVLLAAVALAAGIAPAQSVNKKTGLPDPPKPDQIGRASCRERVYVLV